MKTLYAIWLVMAGVNFGASVIAVFKCWRAKDMASKILAIAVLGFGAETLWSAIFLLWTKNFDMSININARMIARIMALLTMAPLVMWIVGLIKERRDGQTQTS